MNHTGQKTNVAKEVSLSEKDIMGQLGADQNGMMHIWERRNKAAA